MRAASLLSRRLRLRCARAFGAGLVLVFLLSCEPTLERKGVPIAWLVHLDSRFLPTYDPAPWLDRLVIDGYDRVVVELPLKGVPKHYDLAARDVALARLITFEARARGMRVDLALIEAPIDILYQPPDDSAPDSLHRRRLLGYARTIRRLEADTALHPDWILLRGPRPPRLWTLADSARPQRLTIRWTLAPDDTLCPPQTALAVAPERAPDGEHRRQARRLHPRLSALALRCAPQTLIGPLDLLGEDKTRQLQNSLRFWSDSLGIEALLIGTHEAVPAWCDSTSPFGLVADAELRQWLTRYREPHRRP